MGQSQGMGRADCFWRLQRRLFSCLSHLLGAAASLRSWHLPSSSKPAVMREAFLRMHLPGFASNVRSSLALLSSFPCKYLVVTRSPSRLCRMIFTSISSVSGRVLMTRSVYSAKQKKANLAWSFFKLICFVYLTMPGLRFRMQDLSLWCAGSVVVMHGLSCSMSYGILVPQPWMEPKSPSLQGGFLTTGAPGKSQGLFFLFYLACSF